MRSKIILSVFALFLFSAGCGESTSCETLVWEAPESNQVVGLRISAGNKCENYNDYYKSDLKKVIKQIQSMKIVLDRKCYGMIPGENDDDEMEVECPEFVSETIEFGEMVKCSFGTPPAPNTKCMADPLILYFKNSGYFELILWRFNRVENPVLKKGSQEIRERAFSSSDNGISMIGYFNDDNLTSATIVFTWTEETEEKILEFSAKVETKK
ncbi:MAG: hypothetical protein ACOX2F_06210 [bacterium]